MSFSQGLSGLNVNAKALDVVGNNVANSNTAGFKAANAAFADVYAASLAGAGQIGIGANIVKINQLFNQGNIKITSNPLDLAINGQGFYRLSNNGTISWTRDGQFHIDKDGYVVNNVGYRLTGYATDANGNIVPSTPVEIHIDTTDLPPRATGASPAATGLQIKLNLDSRESAPTAAFNINDPTSYNSSTSATVYDSLGNAHLLSMYFRKTGPGAWDLYTSLDGSAAVGQPLL
jgi:flagellar hook protein FlgE